jgi:hypothetical protein
MLSFAVYDKQGAARDVAIANAYLFGNDEVPIQADIRFEDGVIRCEKPSADAAGLSLQVRVENPFGGGDLGLVMLRTCLLPDRDEPYLLSLELARHRIMLVLNKLEEWALFDLPADHPVLVQLDQAREQFTAAMVALCHRDRSGATPGPDPVSVLEANAAATKALGLSLDASERLSLLHAEAELTGRLDGSTYAEAQDRADSITADRVMPDNAAKNPDAVGVVLPNPPLIGCSVSPAMFSEGLARAVYASCDFVSMPMRWIDMEPTEGKYSFAKTDKWIEWAVRTAKLPVMAGPLIDFREICVPEWLYIWEHDYETLRELVYEHIKTIVTRYRRTVARWTVCSGLHVNESFALSVEKMMDLTRMCALLVKKLHPAAKVQLEISRPWGEYFARNRKSMPPRMYAEMISQAGIALDAYGIRIQMGQPAPGRITRDLASISDLLDQYAGLDKPLAVTAVGVPSQVIAPPPARAGDGPSTAAPPPPEPGFWRAPWSPETQARWLTQALSVIVGKPYVHSVCWQDLCDSPQADMPGGGLLTESGAAKPAAVALTDLRRAVQAKRSPLDLSPVGRS